MSLSQAQGWQGGILKPLSGGIEGEKPYPIISFRVSFSLLILAAIFMFLVFRLFQLQVIEGKVNFVRSEENRLRIKRVSPERGLIYDRSSTVLAKNAPAFTVGLDLTVLKEEDDLMVVDSLSRLLPLSKPETLEKVRLARLGGRQEVILLRGVSRDLVLALETLREPLIGVFTDTAPVRQYSYPELYAHVLGYSGEVSNEDLKEFSQMSLTSGDVVGKTGLERFYEPQLHGKVGKILLEHDATGRKLREVAQESPLRGNSLVLTIDNAMQKAAFAALEKSVKENKAVGGAVVVLKANTGEVLALVSYPSFDANMFSGIVATDKYSSLLEDKSLPFFDRSVSALYPPASTFKLVTATAALSEGVIAPQDTIEEVQSISVGGSTFANWTLAWGVAPHGLLDIEGAIAQSSDIYFYEVGGGYQDQKGVGPQSIASFARDFGFGERSGIDLPGESAGLVPDPEYKEREKGETWYLGDTYITAIGQGDLLATPLQVAVMTQMVANGGTYYRPYLVSRVIDNDGDNLDAFSPTQIRKLKQTEQLSFVRRGMREAVEYGTAVELKDHPGEIAAKTGTAETGVATQLHAWFTSFAPYSQPEIVVTTFLEGGGQGSRTALPVAKAIYDEYFHVQSR